MDFKQQPAPTLSTYLITVSALFLHWPVISHYVYFIPKASEKHGSMALRERSLVVERRNGCPHRRVETHNYSLKVAEAHTQYINVLRHGRKGQRMIWWMWVEEKEAHLGRVSRILCEPCKRFDLWVFFAPWTVVPADVHATKTNFWFHSLKWWLVIFTTPVTGVMSSLLQAPVKWCAAAEFDEP